MDIRLFIKKIFTKKTTYATFTVIILVLLALGARKIVTSIGAVLSSHTTRKIESPASAFGDLIKPDPGKPKRLLIAKAGINTNVVTVGKDGSGFMQTPLKWGEAGWFDGSSKTTQEGNIIINGHYDDNHGNPAAFWKLKSVALNDRVDVVDEYGRPFAYEVKDIYYVAIDDPDRFKIFNFEKGKQTLTLITCGGVWLPGQSTYNKRLIIRAERVD